MKGVWKFTAGAAVGAASALLAAPKTGQKARQRLAALLVGPDAIVTPREEETAQTPPAAPALQPVLPAVRSQAPAAPPPPPEPEPLPPEPEQATFEPEVPPEPEPEARVAQPVEPAPPVVAPPVVTVQPEIAPPEVAASQTPAQETFQEQPQEAASPIAGLAAIAPAATLPEMPTAPETPGIVPAEQSPPPLEDLRARIEETRAAVREAIERPFRVEGAPAEASAQQFEEKASEAPASVSASDAAEWSPLAEPPVVARPAVPEATAPVPTESEPAAPGPVEPAIGEPEPAQPAFVEPAITASAYEAAWKPAAHGEPAEHDAATAAALELQALLGAPSRAPGAAPAEEAWTEPAAPADGDAGQHVTPPEEAATSAGGQELGDAAAPEQAPSKPWWSSPQGEPAAESVAEPVAVPGGFSSAETAQEEAAAPQEPSAHRGFYSDIYKQEEAQPAKVEATPVETAAVDVEKPGLDPMAVQEQEQGSDSYWTPLPSLDPEVEDAVATENTTQDLVRDTAADLPAQLVGDAAAGSTPPFVEPEPEESRDPAGLFSVVDGGAEPGAKETPALRVIQSSEAEEPLDTLRAVEDIETPAEAVAVEESVAAEQAEEPVAEAPVTAVETAETPAEPAEAVPAVVEAAPAVVERTDAGMGAGEVADGAAPVAEPEAALGDLAEGMGDQASSGEVQVDQAEMRRRIEETRARLKAKAFDAMANGEGALLSRDSEPASSEAPAQPLEADVEQALDRSLSREDD